ncbi:MAG: isopentenyl phosphate kinase [Haloferacaceae archaeon]
MTAHSSGASGPVVLKLGGSVITDKSRPETLDGPALTDAADAIAEARSAGTVEKLLIVHGGGSFGHHHADRYGVTTEAGTHDAGKALAIHGAMTTLNRFVLSRLHERDVPALPVHPLSAAARDGEGTLSYPESGIETMLAEGFVPVTHGDGVPHCGEGVSVLSGDEIVSRLATGLDAYRVGVCSTVPGVLDGDGEVIPEIETFAEVESALGGSDSTDVSGGMAGKVRELLELEAPASVFGPDDLAAFLRGESPGTRIDGAD